MKKPNQVRIEVSGGVAYLKHKPEAVEVVIHDHDNAAEDPTRATDTHPAATYVSKHGEPTNAARAKHAAALLALGLYSSDDLETAVVDFLADLHHLCARKGLPILDILDRARMHFTAEATGIE